MLHQRQIRIIHRGLVAASLVLAGAAPALGQQATTAQTPAQPGGTVLQLSMQQAEAMALETNLGLKASRLDLDTAAQNILGARSAFLPLFQSNLSRNTAQQAPQVNSDGTSSVASSNTLNVQSTFSQRLPWYGSQFQVSWSGNRLATLGSNSTFNPRLGSTLGINFTQPLLRNLKIDANRNAIETTERLREITDLTVRQQIVSTQAAVDLAYLGLKGAISSRAVAQQNLDLAKESERDSRARVAVGVSAQIDIIQTQVLVAQSEEALIVADAQIATAEDSLRQLILDPSRPDYWQVHLELTDEIQPNARAIDVDAAIKNALANRLDLQSARRNSAVTDLNLKLNENLNRPAVDFVMNYSSSGTGGTQVTNGAQSIKSFGSVLGDTLGAAYPSWTLGVNVTYPLGTTSAEVALATTRIQKQKEELGLRDLELQIVTAVRQAARQVETDYKRVQATLTAQQATQQQLEAEQRKFAVGLSDTFKVQQFELQAAQARTSAVGALIAYNRDLILFDRVQKIR
jgi:outer membrane protein TolC